MKTKDVTRINARKFYKAGRDPVKVTALLYLKESLLKERYEECADIVAIALEFGALSDEIQNLLEEPRREV